MQISTDILSLVMPKIDPGMGVRQRAGPKPESGFRFNKVLEEALSETESPVTAIKKPVTPVAGKDTAPDKPRMPDDEPDETIAAGIMGNQEKVVFILEGDMESATTPDIGVDFAAAVGAPSADAVPDEPDDEADTAEVKPGPELSHAAYADTAAEAQGGANVTTVAYQAEIGEAQNATDKANGKRSAGMATDTANAAKEDDDPQGEVTARMPIIRTSEPGENEDNRSGFSNNGNLSPLENDNDSAPVKGQKEKPYSETFGAARGKAESTRDTAVSTPPLAHGIKPEQFRADQVMKQAAPEAPVRTENLFDEMISRIETMQTDSVKTMTIQLKPEFLGKVALEIAMDASGLHVRIDAGNSDVRAMINGQINALIESLENKGIEVAEVEVAYTGINNGEFKEPREGGQTQPDNRRKQIHRADAIEGTAYYSALPVETLDYFIDAGISSVEYSA